MFQDYTELRNLYREKREPILILINNEDIVIDGKPIFYPKWVEKGIFTAQDILYDYGKYLSFYAFQGKYSLTCTFFGLFASPTCNSQIFARESKKSTIFTYKK